jgi:nudix-type nucleoside diphosphatase (YffH/AdpP family)
MKYQILSESTVYSGYFHIRKATVRHDTFGDGPPLEIIRESLELDDSVGVLVHQVETNSLILTNQFRYPAVKKSHDWIWEVAAGSVEAGEDPEDCARREVLEELGYQIDTLEHISTFYVSPGVTSERIILFYTSVGEKNALTAGGGRPDEKEDIRREEIPVSQIREYISTGRIIDAKTLIALQWFLLAGK